jgi:hypothetical protein
MMQSSAYFLFQESNALSPGYRESVEMMEQSKFNATIKVVVEPACGITTTGILNP